MQITQVNGVDIIEREPGLAPHPHPSHEGKLVPFEGLEHILLADGTETEMCNRCGFTHDNPQSVVAHMASHGNRPKSLYDDETLKALIRAVVRAKRAGIRGHCERAAAELNAAGLRTTRGEEFNGSLVSHLYQDHHKRFPRLRVSERVTEHKAVEEHHAAEVARETKEQSVGKVAAAKAAVRARTDNLEVVDPAQLSGAEKQLVNNRVRRVRELMKEVSLELVFLDKYVTELEQKARAYDKMKDAMRGL